VNLAIIPARGGSKRIPDKNVAMVAGRPLLAWVLDAVDASAVYDVVHVSTDSAAIAEVAAAAGHPVPFLRDPALADDHTPVLPVLRWVAERLEDDGAAIRSVTFVAATAALLEPDDHRAALTLFDANLGAIPVMGVSPYPVPIEWAFDLDDDDRLRPVDASAHAIRSQDLTTRWFDSGVISVWSVAHLRAAMPPAPLALRLPSHRAIDIDEPDDLAALELLLLGREAGRR
jgi:N-acylneuraminate cytidylyltransferase